MNPLRGTRLVFCRTGFTDLLKVWLVGLLGLIGLIWLVWASSPSAFAQASQPLPSQGPVDFSIPTPKDYARKLDPDSSQAIREGKIVSFGAEGGFSPYPGFGAQVGFFLRPQLMLEFGASIGHWKSLPNGFTRYDSQLYSAHAKFFFGNSFYANVGLGVQYLKRLEIRSHPDDAVEKTYTAHSVSVGQEVVVGQRWQWSFFFVGIDWLGLYFPFGIVARSYESKGFTGSDKDKETNAGYRRDFYASQPAPLPLGLRLHVGLAL